MPRTDNRDSAAGRLGRMIAAVLRLLVRSAALAADDHDAAEHRRRMQEMQDEHRKRWERGARQTDGTLD